MPKTTVKDKVEISKGIFNLLRDASIFLIFILLLFRPEDFNNILARAGFEEGSLVGFKWKNQVEKSS